MLCGGLVAPPLHVGDLGLQGAADALEARNQVRVLVGELRQGLVDLEHLRRGLVDALHELQRLHLHLVLPAAKAVHLARDRLDRTVVGGGHDLGLLAGDLLGERR